MRVHPNFCLALGDGSLLDEGDVGGEEEEEESLAPTLIVRTFLGDGGFGKDAGATLLFLMDVSLKSERGDEGVDMEKGWGLEVWRFGGGRGFDGGRNWSNSFICRDRFGRVFFRAAVD